MPKLKDSKYEQFALEYVKDPTQNLAALYLRTVSPRCSKGNAASQASAFIAAGHEVANRIAELQAEIRQRAEEKNAKDKASGKLPTFLTVEEKRAFLTRVVRFEPGNYDPVEDADIPNGIKKTQWGTTYEIPDKLTAIKLDNDLSGDGAAAKGQSSLVEGLSKLVKKLRI